MLSPLPLGSRQTSGYKTNDNFFFSASSADLVESSFQTQFLRVSVIRVALLLLLLSLCFSVLTMSEPVTSVDKPTISVDDLDAWDNLLSPASTSPPPSLRSASSSSSASSGEFNAFSFVGAHVAARGGEAARLETSAFCC